MTDTLALLDAILRTAHVTGLSREHQEAIGEALAAQVVRGWRAC